MTEEVNINGQEQNCEQEIREGQRKAVSQKVLRVGRVVRASARTKGPVLPSKPTTSQLEYLCKIHYYHRNYLENLRLDDVAKMLTRCDQLVSAIKPEKARRIYHHPKLRHLSP